jgi:hypothetical protein
MLWKKKRFWAEKVNEIPGNAAHLSFFIVFIAFYGPA